MLPEDIQATPFIGWKILSFVQHDDTGEFGLQGPYVWYPTTIETMVADCRPSYGVPHPHTSPDPDGVCFCGFNAYASITKPLMSMIYREHYVLAEVELFGRVVECTFGDTVGGWRAQKQRIRRLYARDELYPVLKEVYGEDIVKHVSSLDVVFLNKIAGRPVTQKWVNRPDGPVYVVSLSGAAPAEALFKGSKGEKILTHMEFSPTFGGWLAVEHYKQRVVDLDGNVTIETSEQMGFYSEEDEEWTGAILHAKGYLAYAVMSLSSTFDSKLCNICLTPIDMGNRCSRHEDRNLMAHYGEVVKGDDIPGEWKTAVNGVPYYVRRFQLKFDGRYSNGVRTIVIFPKKNSWKVCVFTQYQVLTKKSGVKYPVTQTNYYYNEKKAFGWRWWKKTRKGVVSVDPGNISKKIERTLQEMRGSLHGRVRLCNVCLAPDPNSTCRCRDHVEHVNKPWLRTSDDWSMF